MATKTEYRTEYRMIHIPPSYTPEETAMYMTSLSVELGWTAVTFVPGQILNGRVSGHMLMARAVRK